MSESRATSRLNQVLQSLKENEAVSSDLKLCIDKITDIIPMPDPDKRNEVLGLIADATQMKVRIEYAYEDEVEPKKPRQKSHQKKRSSYYDIELRLTELEKEKLSKMRHDFAVVEQINFMIKELQAVLRDLNPSPTELLKQRKAACSVSYDDLTSPKEVKSQKKFVTFKSETKLSWEEAFNKKLQELLQHLENKAQLRTSASITEEKAESKDVELETQEKQVVMACHNQILKRVKALTDEVQSEYSSLTKTTFEKHLPIFMPRRLTATERAKKNKDMIEIKMCGEKLKSEYLKLTVTDFLADGSLKLYQNSCQFMLDQTALAVDRIKKETTDTFQASNSVFYWEKPDTLKAIENVETRHRRRRSSIS